MKGLLTNEKHHIVFFPLNTTDSYGLIGQNLRGLKYNGAVTVK